MVMDVRFLPNPHWVDELRALTGQNPAVRDYVLGQPGAAEFLADLPSVAIAGLDGYRREGKRYMTVAIGCTGGKHRSVAIAEALMSTAGVQCTTVGAGAAPGSGSRMSSPMSHSIVALGGGHGLYATLSAARRLTPYVTAVVTVADDGGSSGRLRSELDVVPPGDLRMALAALASDSPYGRLWATILQHRFGGSGALAGHPIGNLMLAGLNEVLADPVAALDELGRILGVKGRVLPMCPIALQIEADVVRAGVRPADVPADPRPGGDRDHTGKGAAGAAAARRPAGDPAGRRRHHGRRPGGAGARVVVHQRHPACAGAGAGRRRCRPPPPGARWCSTWWPSRGRRPGFSVERHLHVLAQHAPGFTVHDIIIDAERVPSDRERDQLRRTATLLQAEVQFADVSRPGTPLHDPGKLAAVLDAVRARDKDPEAPPVTATAGDADRGWTSRDGRAWTGRQRTEG